MEHEQEAAVAARKQDELNPDAHKALCAQDDLKLKGEQIRVLEVEGPTTAHGSDMIKATLRRTDLAAGHEPYAALSYVWGEQSSSKTIDCNGSKIAIGDNCHSALWHLRQKNNKKFTIWVDALCIDQHEHCDEKAVQMGLMPKIYANATKVYAWLGSAKDTTGKAVAYLRAAGLRTSYDEEKAIRYEHPFLAARRLLLGFDPYARDVPHEDRACPQDVYDMLDSPWLQRMWTYQEILFANNPIVVRDQHHLAWSELEDALLILTADGSDDLRDKSIIWLGLGQARELMSDLQGPWQLSEKRRYMKEVFKWRSLLGIWIMASFLLPISCATVGGFLVQHYTKDWTDPSSGRMPDGMIAGCIFCAIGGISLVPMWTWIWRVKRAARGDLPARGFVTTAAEIIDGIFDREASRPEDRVYALWNVLQKLGSKDLPVRSTYPKRLSEHDNDELHWHLAKSLVKNTQAINMLRLAAECPKTGSQVPSWVPELNHDDLCRLRIRQELGAIDLQGRSMPFAATVARRQDAEKGAKMVLSQRDRALSVDAREQGIVTTYGSYDEVNAPADSTSAHPDNLTAIVRLSGLMQQLGLRLSEVLNLAANKSVEADEIVEWEQSPQSFKGIEEPTQKMRDWSEVNRIHIAAYKQLAKFRCGVCWLNLHDRNGSFMAFCNGGVRRGDRVLRIRGLPQLIIVRKKAARRVDIVGRLIMSTQLLKKVGDKIKLRPFEEYTIE